MEQTERLEQIGQNGMAGHEVEAHAGPDAMERIDAFAHVLPKNYYSRLIEFEPYVPRRYPYFNQQTLVDMDIRRAHWDGSTRQVISIVNALPEDYCDPDVSGELCWMGNEELMRYRRDNPDMFEAAVLNIPMNNPEMARTIMCEQVLPNKDCVGVQLFTRALGKSIADRQFVPIFEALNDYRISCWLHPVFDDRKPDNNIVFSWEYELTQAMYQMVQARLFDEFSLLKILCHHAGAMVPFFKGRIDNIMPGKFAEQMRNFYVDTAILGNGAALKLAIDFYGEDHLLFGTDAPFGAKPAGATDKIRLAIDEMGLSDELRAKIYHENYRNFIANGDAQTE